MFLASDAMEGRHLNRRSNSGAAAHVSMEALHPGEGYLKRELAHAMRVSDGVPGDPTTPKPA